MAPLTEEDLAKIAAAVWDRPTDAADPAVGRHPAWAFLRFIQQDAHTAAMAASVAAGQSDPKALAKELAPLINSTIVHLSDADLAAVAKAVNDEEGRRQSNG